MNQILVTEKLYITPELKRKKKLYKINFMISIVIILILCSFYIYAEYDRNKEEELSQDILAGMISDEEKYSNNIEEYMSSNESDDEDVWRIIISSAEQQNTTTDTQTENDNETEKAFYTASNGQRYQMVGRIKIPKINVDYAILSETSVEWLKVSPCRFYGPERPNEVGNFCIAGHNYRNKRFFSKVPTLVVGDEIEITDLSGRTITYSIYDKYTVVPEDTSCLDQVTNGQRIVTLITCTDDSKQRVIVHAKEI